MTQYCSYVYNVINEVERKSITRQIKSMLKKDGRAYITVRRDIKSDYVSKKGTHQYIVKLDAPVVIETSDFCIYEL